MPVDAARNRGSVCGGIDGVRLHGIAAAVTQDKGAEAQHEVLAEPLEGTNGPGSSERAHDDLHHGRPRRVGIERHPVHGVENVPGQDAGHARRGRGRRHGMPGSVSPGRGTVQHHGRRLAGIAPEAGEIRNHGLIAPFPALRRTRPHAGLRRDWPEDGHVLPFRRGRRGSGSRRLPGHARRLKGLGRHGLSDAGSRRHESAALLYGLAAPARRIVVKAALVLGTRLRGHALQIAFARRQPRDLHSAGLTA